MHVITPIRGFQFGNDKCANPPDGYTEGDQWTLGSSFGLSGVPPPWVKGNSRLTRLQFGLCCRNEVNLRIEFFIPDEEDPPSNGWTITIIDENGSNQVWAGPSGAVGDNEVINLDFPVSAGPCGAIVQIDSTDGPGNGQILITPIL